MDKTLVILAAGIGSRYKGGIKQLSKVYKDYTLMDYSIYNAKKAGFNKIVFIIRKDIEDYFKEEIGNRINDRIKVEYAHQQLELDGIKQSKNRSKPWGTVSAITSIKNIVNEPFLIINADDYYGPSVFKEMSTFLDNLNNQQSNSKLQLAMIGYRLENTLSKFGSVNRGICIAKDNMLQQIKETKNIEFDNDLDKQSLVSMNVWAADGRFIDLCIDYFNKFIKDANTDLLNDEYILSDLIEELLDKDLAEVKVIPTAEDWYGITYKQDLFDVRLEFAKMINDTVYPTKLW